VLLLLLLLLLLVVVVVVVVAVYVDTVIDSVWDISFVSVWKRH